MYDTCRNAVSAAFAGRISTVDENSPCLLTQVAGVTNGQFHKYNFDNSQGIYGSTVLLCVRRAALYNLSIINLLEIIIKNALSVLILLSSFQQQVVTTL